MQFAQAGFSTSTPALRHTASFRPSWAWAGVAEIIILGMAWFGLIPWFLPLAAHLAFLVGLVSIARQLPVEGTDQAQFCIESTLFALLGPAGAIAAIAIDYMVKQIATPEDALWDWYRSLRLESEMEPSAAIFDNISSGRTVTVTEDIPPDFWQVMKDGSLSQQHWVLAQIASRYHGDYRDLLFDALRSPAPAIRVQAAAIVNGLRTQARTRLNEDLKALGRRPDMTVLIERGCSILDQLGSGLLEESDIDSSAAGIRAAVRSANITILQPRGLYQLRNHVLWAADRLPDQGQRRKLLTLAATINASMGTRTGQTVPAGG